MFALSCWHFQSFYRTCKQSEGRTLFLAFCARFHKSSKILFCAGGLGKAQLYFLQFYEYFFLSLSCRGNVALLLLLLFLAPFTYMLLFRLCLFLVFCEKRFERERDGKSGTCVNYFINFNKKCEAGINQLIIHNMCLSFPINYDRLKCKFFSPSTHKALQSA